MSTIYLADPKSSDASLGNLLDSFERKAHAYPPGTCPLVAQSALLQSAHSQTCGKCVPCRDGLVQLNALLQSVINGSATLGTVDQIRTLATMINETADCAIGYQAAADVLSGLDAFKAEYEAHLATGKCAEDRGQTVPCVTMCPAHVDIPGYIALAAEGDYAGCINLIRRDNPLSTACAMICEHPCEERCRRQILDAEINIRGIKKFAVDQLAADKVAVPAANGTTGKKVAIIGGGPSGLTAAYYLALMGHAVTLYERQKELGGMLRYGIPNYRFPKDRLDEDIRAILSAGDITVHTETWINTPEDIKAVADAYDALYVAIGAQEGKKLRLDNVDAPGVYSAVEMLDEIGNGFIPDYTGKNVVVIGGGNVAMDAARSAVRCGADSVSIAYRRRQEDMTALESEVEAAIAEGIELYTLYAPKAIEVDEAGNCSGLLVQPQMIGPYDKAGRPAPLNADKPAQTLAADIVLIAVGQGILSEPFEAFGMPAQWNQFTAGLDTAVAEMPGVFVGGDCATGPSTAIRAIAAGKVASHNIDEFLGYHHTLDCGAKAPAPRENNRTLCGRTNITERPAGERKLDFEHVENRLTIEEAVQEARRCLRCDHFGCGSVEGGSGSW